MSVLLYFTLTDIIKIIKKCIFYYILLSSRKIIFFEKFYNSKIWEWEKINDINLII